MASFVEQATLKIVDQSTGQIKKINAALKDLFKTAKSLKSTKIDIAVKETGTKQAIHALRKLNRELAKLKGNANLGINVKGLKQANAAARQMSQSMRQMQSSRKLIGTGTADAMRTQQRAAAGAARVQQRAAAGAARVQQRTAAAAKTEQLKFPAFRRPLGTGTGTTDAARLARRTESSKAARMQARVDAPLQSFRKPIGAGTAAAARTARKAPIEQYRDTPFPAYRRPIGAGTAEAMRGQNRRAGSAERGGAASGAARPPKPTRHDSFTKRVAHEIPHDIVRGGIHKVIDTTVDAAKSGFWEEESARFRLRSRQETPERQGQIESAVRDIGEDMEKGGGRFYNPAQTTKLFLEALGQTAGDIEGAQHLTRRAIESTRARVGAGVPLEKAEEDAAQLIKAGDLRDAFYSVRRDASGKAVKDSGGRVIEDVDHKGIDEFYNNVNKVATVMGEQDFSGANVKQITKYLRASKEALTESAYNRTLFMGESMGTSAGVGLTQAQRMFRGQTTVATQKQLLQMGLLKQVGGTAKKPVFAPAEGGQTEIQDPDDPTKRISVAADLARDPYRHLHRAMDVMEQQGIDLSDRAALTARLQRLGGTSTAQDWGVEAGLRRRNLDQKELMAARIKGDSAAMDRNAQQSPHLKLVAAEQQLKSTLGNVFSAAAPYLVDNVIDPIRKRAAEMTEQARAGEKVDWSGLMAGGGATVAAFGAYNALKGIQKGDVGGLSSAGFSLLQAGSSLSAAATALGGIPALFGPGGAMVAAIAAGVATANNEGAKAVREHDTDVQKAMRDQITRGLGLDKPQEKPSYDIPEPFGPPTGPEAPGVKKGGIKLKPFGAKPATKPTLWPMGTEVQGPEETYGPPTPEPKALHKMMKSFYDREKESFAGPAKRGAMKITLTKPQVDAPGAQITPSAGTTPSTGATPSTEAARDISAPGATISASGATIEGTKLGETPAHLQPDTPVETGTGGAGPVEKLKGIVDGIVSALSVAGAQAAESKKPAAEGAKVAEQTVNAGSVVVHGAEVKTSATGEGAGAAQPGAATDLSAQIAQISTAATALGASVTALAAAGTALGTSTATLAAAGTAVGTSISTSATSLAAAGTTIGTAISNAGTSLASSLQTGVSALTNAGTSIGAAISNAGTSLQGAVATAAASFQQASSAIAQGGAAAAASLQAGAASVAASGATAAAGLQQGAAAVAASGSQAAGALQGAAPGIGAAIGASAASAIRAATASISINVKHSGLTGTDTGGQKPD